MTTADRTPHPWSLNIASALVDPTRPIPRRSTSPTREGTAATSNRMLLDEHRSKDGLCVRCENLWPCDAIRSIRFGSTA
ncbi:hypothetical protein C7C46_07015 [Streptomyces tateyamensis]|uniref:Uncharacterized protein n=1 Tax=Streptomyces tateyamensis TaxID=565073 RepID=A0A2V4NXE9_9ACTN|nr:hypothetical protein [Streptomyces tateyamensis]PYC85045.1 hypothetical protein C7C46_07015 [Streptomyces tateyamensis]